MKVRLTSMMFEDRTGYQLFTVKLKAADVVTDPELFASLPDIIMRKIPTADRGEPLYIRYVCSFVQTSTTATLTSPVKHRFVKPGVNERDMAEHLLTKWLLPRMEDQRTKIKERLGLSPDAPIDPKLMRFQRPSRRVIHTHIHVHAPHPHVIHTQREHIVTHHV